MKEQGGIVRDRPKICDKIAESAGEMIEVWGRKYLPKLKGKTWNIGEIRRRDRQGIAKDFKDVMIRVADQMDELARRIDEK
ncbi:hypothetical protein [Wolbachia pipientis]|uniref:hypothetical protein n=1 Tax=Wolbachia pipientis TaxID=955 RepID=UPI0032D58981